MSVTLSGRQYDELLWRAWSTSGVPPAPFEEEEPMFHLTREGRLRAELRLALSQARARLDLIHHVHAELLKGENADVEQCIERLWSALKGLDDEPSPHPVTTSSPSDDNGKAKP